MQRKNHRDLARPHAGALEVIVEAPARGFRHLVTPALLREFLPMIPAWGEVSRGLKAIILDEGSGGCEGWYDDGVIGLHAWPDSIATTVCAWHYAAHRELWARLGVAARAAPEYLGAVEFSADTSGMHRRAFAALSERYGLYDWAVESGAAADEWIVRDESDRPARPAVVELIRVGDALHLYLRSVFMRFDRRSAAAYQLLHVLLHELGHHVDARRTRRGLLRGGEGYAERWALRCADRIWEACLARLEGARL